MVSPIGRELELLHRCVLDGDIALGGRTARRFEQEFADYHGMPEAIATSSGTAAIHLALAALGVSPGDAVVCPAISFIGGINPIRFCGAEPVFLGVEADSLNLDPETLASFFDQRTVRGRRAGDDDCSVLRGSKQRLAAVVVADLYGQPADLDAILRICHEHGVPVVADAAESLGARRRGVLAGTLADVSCFSFNTNKVITSGGGGMLLCRDPALAARCRHLRVHARCDAFEYRHDCVGFNYRMSNLCAAVGCAQLEKLNAQIDRNRKRARRFAEMLAPSSGLELLGEPENTISNGWMMLGRAAGGGVLSGVRRAAERAVPVRPVWYPAHRMALYAASEYWGAGQEMSYYRRTFCFKSSELLTEEELERAARVLAEELGSE